ncbi:Toxin PezT [compost metagenome]
MCGTVGIEEPNSILLGGGSAAGKSRSSRILLKLDSTEDDGDEVTIIDCDKIKERLPEYADFYERYPETWAFLLHDESSDISDKAIQKCIETKRDFIYDGTMKNIEKYEKLISQLKSQNYKVSAMIFDVPIKTALERNKKRHEIEGRFVPEEIVIETHMEVSRAFLKLKNLVDEFVLYDNRTEYPEIISLRWADSEEIVRDREKLQEFIDKSTEIFRFTGTSL